MPRRGTECIMKQRASQDLGSCSLSRKLSGGNTRAGEIALNNSVDALYLQLHRPCSTQKKKTQTTQLFSCTAAEFQRTAANGGAACDPRDPVTGGSGGRVFWDVVIVREQPLGGCQHISSRIMADSTAGAGPGKTAAATG